MNILVLLHSTTGNTRVVTRYAAKTLEAACSAAALAATPATTTALTTPSPPWALQRARGATEGRARPCALSFEDSPGEVRRASATLTLGFDGAVRVGPIREAVAIIIDAVVAVLFLLDWVWRGGLHWRAVAGDGHGRGGRHGEDQEGSFEPVAVPTRAISVGLAER